MIFNMIPTSLFQMLAWNLLPDVITNFALHGLHRLYQSPPPPGSPTYHLHRKTVFTCVLLSYFVYTFISAALSVPPNFYQLLNATRDMDEQGLAKAFRRFAIKSHPDRAGVESEDLFVVVRAAFEALKSPTKRFAYDRFGPDALEWKADTRHLIIRQGILHSCGWYIVTGAIFGLAMLLGRGRNVIFWRLVAFVGCAALELFLVLRPTPLICRVLFPSHLPFQFVEGMHQIIVSLSVGLERIAPLWTQPVGDGEAVLQTLAQVANAVDEEVLGQLQHDLQQLQEAWNPSLRSRMHDASSAGTPLLVDPDPTVVEELRHAIVDTIVDKRLQNHPTLGPLWLNAVRKRARAERHEIDVAGRVEPARLPSPPRSVSPVGETSMDGLSAAADGPLKHRPTRKSNGDVDGRRSPSPSSESSESDHSSDIRVE